MAGPDRRPPVAVIDRLFAQPWRFEFCQAVRLLEALVRAPKPVGESGNPKLEPIRFRAAATLGFEGAPVRQVTPPLISLTTSAMETYLRQDGSSVAQADMAVSFFGLAGTVGALPLADTERLLRAVQRRDPAMADFLSLFENRLIAVYYRARKAQRPAFDPVPPEDSALALYLQAVMGFALPAVAASLPADLRRRLLPFAGLLAGVRRPMEGLRKLLTGALSLPVAIEAPVPRMATVAVDQRSALGLRLGRFQALGKNAVLGGRLSDGGRTIRLWIGPLDRAIYDGLLPGGQGYETLRRLAGRYLGDGYSVEVRLVLHAEGVSGASLSAKAGARLGLTSWLLGRAADSDACEARFALPAVR
ncbi:type VI secretion system baseplate subunit TssG [Oceanibaculum sp.]|uniref:type VI secretion system baseplate subunit TssG n=1 Tax=Oceanibaculum sp. TaxID=1903597 RepID=UPI002587ECD3|nr:type VI secretion system baseplate subunit TssG [Oceanibaculum sp.]MCH2395760.1 type VI secretion system baseplate subunit TssG [Oceanibaculum sp.]